MYSGKGMRLCDQRKGNNKRKDVALEEIPS
jgi:hypothetical protein